MNIQQLIQSEIDKLDETHQDWINYRLLEPRLKEFCTNEDSETISLFIIAEANETSKGLFYIIYDPEEEAFGTISANLNVYMGPTGSLSDVIPDRQVENEEPLEIDERRVSLWSWMLAVTTFSAAFHQLYAGLTGRWIYSPKYDYFYSPKASLVIGFAMMTWSIYCFKVCIETKNSISKPHN